MTEAEIYRIHFGDYRADIPIARSKEQDYGDYGVWLSYRRATRTDHKFAPGKPCSLDGLKYEGGWLQDAKAEIVFLNIEQTADIEAALQALTPAQRKLIRALIYDGATPAEYARDNGINKSVVSRTLKRAKEALRKIYESKGN